MMKDLVYHSPVYGGRGLMGLGAQIPECFIMMIGPPSCGIHSAIKLMEKDYQGNNGYLFLTESELAMGDIERNIYEAVDKVISVRPKRPRVFILLFTCIVFIVGVDQDVVRMELRKRYPDITFQITLMNPISFGTDHPPGVMLHSRMAELFDRYGEQENALNFLGNGVPVDHDSEIYDVIKACGVKRINHVIETKTFDEFREMGRAKYNLVIGENGLRAAQEMVPRMDYRYLLTRYDMKGITEQYEEIFSMLGQRCDISGYRENAQKAVDETAAFLDGKTVGVGASCSSRLFNVARLLLENGVDVTKVFTDVSLFDVVDPYDRDDYEWVLQNHSEVEIYQANDPTMMDKRGKCGSIDLAVGFTAAYFTQTSCIANVMFDEGLYAFGGTITLMKELRKAMEKPRDLRALVMEYGLVI